MAHEQVSVRNLVCVLGPRSLNCSKLTIGVVFESLMTFDTHHLNNFSIQWHWDRSRLTNASVGEGVWKSLILLLILLFYKLKSGLIYGGWGGGGGGGVNDRILSYYVSSQQKKQCC